MFTGIISEVGEVVATGDRLTVRAPRSAGRLELGGSVAVNGACLTAVAIAGEVFAVDVVDETLRRTNLGALRPGSRINLELPLAAGQALDGHLVQGHVDATSRIAAIEQAKLGREVSFELPAELAPYVAEKGSIAIDGVSLTVAGVDDGHFSIALIPHTLEQTIAGRYESGAVVNLEVDLIARYLERLVRRGIERD